MPIQGLVTNGWLVVVAAGPDGSLGCMRKIARPNGWMEWEDLGVRIASAPAVFHNEDGRVEIFAVGPDGLLGHMWQLESGEGWSEWDRLGPAVTGDPAVFHNAAGHLEVFAAGPERNLGHTWQEVPSGYTGWAPWGDLGPAITGRPTVFQNSDGRLEVFAAGSEGLLGHIWQTAPNNGWSEWEEFGPAISSDPVMFQNADRRLEVFAVGADGLLGHTWQTMPTHAWAPWDAFAGIAVSGTPSVFQNADGRLELFAVGPDGVLGHIWQTEPSSGWSAWDAIGPEVMSDPIMFQNADGRIEVFAIGANGRLGHRWQLVPSGESGWSPWEDLGPSILGSRLAVSQSGTSSHADADTWARRDDPRSRPVRPPRELKADVLVIGAGPAGITVSDGLVRAGASVVLAESGLQDGSLAAQELNDGVAEGPLIKGYATYLRDGRRRAVQGSASRWGPGFCMPFRSNDLDQRPWVPLSGWPLTVEELAPYEERAAATFGFAPFSPPRADGQLVRLQYRFPDNPQVFVSMYFDLLPRPLFTPELGATALELQVRGDRVDAVRFACEDGADLTVRADTVVLATGAIENARILLLHERTIPTSGMTGRCFMEHPHVLAGRVRLPDSEPFRACLEGGSALEVLALADDALAEGGLLNASVQLRPHGWDHSAAGPVECDLYVRAEQAPNPDSRLVLADRVDRFGFAQPLLRWNMLENDWATVVRTSESVLSALTEESGAEGSLGIRLDDPWPAAPAGPSDSWNSTWGNHHMGTTRMAESAADGAVDPNGLLHGTANLYVAGSSVFPTGGCANPTFMIVALAHRLVDHLAAASR